jgi:hypothetical protein
MATIEQLAEILEALSVLQGKIDDAYPWPEYEDDPMWDHLISLHVITEKRCYALPEVRPASGTEEPT